MAKEFPDLTGDGKVTQADVLKGRGVFQDGGSIDDQMQMAMNQPMPVSYTHLTLPTT